jgi:hypothetical protein
LPACKVKVAILAENGFRGWIALRKLRHARKHTLGIVNPLATPPTPATPTNRSISAMSRTAS